MPNPETSAADQVLAREVMTCPVRAVRDDASVVDAARRMTAHRVGALAVLDGKGRGIGVVSASDIVSYEMTRARRLMGPARYAKLGSMGMGKEPGGFVFQWSGEAKVRDVMTQGIVTAPSTATLGEVAWIMSQKRIHRVFLGKSGRILGVVSSFDVARVVGRASGPACSLR